MDNLTNIANAFADKRDGAMFLKGLRGIYDRYSCQMTSTAGLVITATSGKKVPKTGSSICYGTVKGAPFSIAAGEDLCAISGTVSNGTFNVVCFFANIADQSLTAANMTSIMGTAGATMEAVKFPAFPEGKTLIGYIIINPAGTGDFTGDSTALDDGTVFSSGGTVYVSPVGPFDPSATF